MATSTAISTLKDIPSVKEMMPDVSLPLNGLKDVTSPIAQKLLKNPQEYEKVLSPNKEVNIPLSADPETIDALVKSEEEAGAYDE
jgi:hypothetical protein